jgi:hypothetical protein
MSAYIDSLIAQRDRAQAKLDALVGGIAYLLGYHEPGRGIPTTDVPPAELRRVLEQAIEM